MSVMKCPYCKGDGNFDKFDSPGPSIGDKCIHCEGTGLIAVGRYKEKCSKKLTQS